MAYQRLNVQSRVVEFLKWDKKRNYEGIRVRPGYQVNQYLENFEKYIHNPQILDTAICESDIKQDGSATSINFNLSLQASRNLQQLKTMLDERTNRHLFPAQVLDIFLICVKELTEKPPVENRSISDKEVALVLNEFVGDLIAERQLNSRKAKAKQAIVETLIKNDLLGFR